MERISKVIVLLIVIILLSSCGKKLYVVFDYNCNGQEYHKCELKNNKLNCKVEIPTCGEYKFKGWYKANEYENQVDLNGTFNKNEIIYARWEENGQVIESSSQELVSTIIIPTPIDQPSSSQVEYSSKIEYSSQEEPSSQKPTPEATYTISFNLNGGSGGQSQQISGVKYGNDLPAINQTKPTKAGYTFTGWYDSKEGGTQYYNSSNSPVKKYDKKSNITLYAHFNACPKGQYAASGATSCSACTGNTYTSTTGQSKCSTCATGYKANSDHTGCTANVLSIQYNGNGGTWNNPSKDTYGVNSSGTVILKSTNQVYTQKINYGSKIESGGLIDYNGSWFNWKKDKYEVEAGKEYILGSTVLDQTKRYSAIDLAKYGGCDLSKSDCTVTIKVNWKKNEWNIDKDYGSGKWVYYNAYSAELKTYYSSPLAFGEYFPSKAVSSGNSLPIIIWLHGSGGDDTYAFRGSGLLKVASEWSNTGLKNIPAIIMAPQLTADTSWGDTRSVSTIKALIKYAKEKYNANTKKVVLMGHSQGGSGVVTVSKYNQNLFSALVIMSGYAGSPGNYVDYFKKIPMKGYSEEIGNIDPKTGEYRKTGEIMTNFFKAAGHINDLTIYKNAKHGEIPKIAFSEDKNNDKISDVFYWAFSQ